MSTQFALATAAQLRADLSLPEGKNSRVRKAALRATVNNMTLNNSEMLKLFPEVIRCMHSSDPGTKRLCFLYLETYVKSRPQHQHECLSQLTREVTNTDSPPAIRGAALRTLSSVSTKAFASEAMRLIPNALGSDDAYLRKTACYAVAKAWAVVPNEVEHSELIPKLNQMLVRENSPIAITAAVQSLLSITDQTPRLQFVVDAGVARRLVGFLRDCSDFSHVAILSAVSRFVPESAAEADGLIQRILPGLRHSNTAVAMGSARVLLMLAHYGSEQFHESVPQQVITRLLPQLNRPPELEYAVLRNIYLLLQTIDTGILAKTDIPPATFFFRASDKPYIRATKIDILVQLCTQRTAPAIVDELGEFFQLKSDLTSRRRAILALGKLGIRFESVVDACVNKLASVVREEPDTVTALVDISRRYPSNAQLLHYIYRCATKVSPPQAEESRRAYFWIMASAGDSEIANATQFFATALQNFTNECPAVQAVILTNCVTLFLRSPDQTKNRLVPNVFELATQNTLDPDVRDRAFIYWRLLQASPQRAAGVINQHLPPIAAQVSNLDENQLEDLELSLGFISSLYLKPGDQLFRQASSRQLGASPALRPRARNAAVASVVPAPDVADTSDHPFATPKLTSPGQTFETPTSQSSTQKMTSVSPSMSPAAQRFPSPTHATLAAQPSGSSSVHQPQHLLYQNTADSHGSLLDSFTMKPPAPRSRGFGDVTPVEELNELNLETTPSGEQSVRLIDI